MAEDSELWDVIYDGPFVHMKTIGKTAATVPKIRKEYNEVDRKAIEKKLPIKEDPRTTQVKQSKIDMLNTKYELFKMNEDESIQDIHTRFTSIINELHSLGEIILKNKLVKKTLSMLPGSWESKVNAITEEKDLQKLMIDELFGNFKTYEMKKKKKKKKKKKN
ncbi:uncharacterized protein [Nicotiana sylvestris]|uniref:uncharacterized protein n=1 Tax=Nicotiana sylvestris TaxID=4096 RepID=UPI00388CB282